MKHIERIYLPPQGKIHIFFHRGTPASRDLALMEQWWLEMSLKDCGVS